MKKIVITLSLFLVTHYAYPQAQNIYFNFVDCSNAQYPITDIRSITFSSLNGTLILSKKNWTEEIWPISYVGSYNFTGFNCATGINSLGADVYNSINVYPNIGKELFKIKYTTIDEKSVVIELYGLNGQLLKQIMNSVSTPGTHEILWYGKDEKGNQLPAGSYIISLIVDGKILSKNITITN